MCGTHRDSNCYLRVGTVESWSTVLAGETRREKRRNELELRMQQDSSAKLEQEERKSSLRFKDLREYTKVLVSFSLSCVLTKTKDTFSHSSGIIIKIRKFNCKFII